MPRLPQDELSRLERRVARLELAVVQAVAWLTATVLVAGSVMPYLPLADGFEPEGESTGDNLDSLLTAGFQAIGWRNAEGEGPGGMVAFGVGFLGLLAVTFVALFLLYLIGSAQATPRTPRVMKVAATLMTIGTVVAGLLSLAALGNDDLRLGWGLPLYGAGVGLFWVVVASRLREWWDVPGGTSLSTPGR